MIEDRLRAFAPKSAPDSLRASVLNPGSAREDDSPWRPPYLIAVAAILIGLFLVNWSTEANLDRQLAGRETPRAPRIEEALPNPDLLALLGENSPGIVLGNIPRSRKRSTDYRAEGSSTGALRLLLEEVRN